MVHSASISEVRNYTYSESCSREVAIDSKKVILYPIIRKPVCSRCKNKILPQDHKFSLACGHHYHLDCIKNTLKSGSSNFYCWESNCEAYLSRSELISHRLIVESKSKLMLCDICHKEGVDNLMRKFSNCPHRIHFKCQLNDADCSICKKLVQNRFSSASEDFQYCLLCLKKLEGVEIELPCCHKKVHKQCFENYNMKCCKACGAEMQPKLQKCSICKNGGNIETLDCSHTFHIDCLEKVVAAKNVICLMCKKPIEGKVLTKVLMKINRCSHCDKDLTTDSITLSCYHKFHKQCLQTPILSTKMLCPVCDSAENIIQIHNSFQTHKYM